MRILFLFLFFSFSLNGFASPELYRLPGLVPLKVDIMPSTDLMLDGQLLMPHEATILKSQGMDLSLLQPQESDVWKNIPQIDNPDDSIEVFDFEELKYLEIHPAPTGGFRFIAQKTFPNGEIKTYSIFIHKRVHTFLLRKELLRKLGYRVPAVKRLKNVKVSFNGVISKKRFLGTDKKEECNPEQQECNLWENNLARGAGGVERWVLNLEDNDSSIVELQDVVIMNSDEPIYNLAMAPGDHTQMAGRRVFNSLLLPYNLVDLRESVNGMFYYSARKYNNALYFPLEDEEEFRPSIEDSLWMARRIQQLDRIDFEEIVQAAELPKSVALLLTEKLISRRNEMLKLLNLPFEPIPFNPKVTLEPELIKGELKKTSWEGYGSHFSYGPHPSPISGPEIRAFFKSKTISTLISEAIVRVNRDLMPHTQLEQAIIEKQKDLILDQFVDYLITGEQKDIPFGYWTHPTFSGNLILSREVVAGSYLGTDNSIQLVDTIGYAVDAGLYIGTHGLPTNVSADGQAKAFWTRTYSHLKPLMSIRAANAEPFKNILVPLLKRNYGKILDSINSENFKAKTPEEQQEIAGQLANLLREELGDGESLIITDNIGGMINARAGYRFNERVKLQVQAGDQLRTVSRLHILRRGNEFQIYKDRGNANTLSISVTLNAGIQLVNLGYSLTTGSAKVLFHKANIANRIEVDGKYQPNPQLITNLRGIREALIENDVEIIAQENPPYVIKHNFVEKATDFRFLFFSALGLKSRTKMKIYYPEESKPFRLVKQSIGQRWGKDFQQLTVDVLNFMIEEYANFEAKIVNTVSGDPGDTLFGSSKARNVVFEAEQNDDNYAPDPLLDRFARISYRWKGWKASKKEALKIIGEIQRDFKMPLYPETVMALTKDLELYIVSLNIHIYEAGLNKVLDISINQLKKLLDRYHKKPLRTDDRISGGAYKFEKEIRRFRMILAAYRSALKDKDTNDMAKAAAKLVSFLENHLTIDGLIEAVGGEDNIYIYSKVDGFKKGEDGEQNSKSSLYSSDIGEYGSPNYFGPLQRFQSEMGISESEFYLYWMLRKL